MEKLYVIRSAIGYNWQRKIKIKQNYENYTIEWKNKKQKQNKTQKSCIRNESSNSANEARRENCNKNGPRAKNQNMNETLKGCHLVVVTKWNTTHNISVSNWILRKISVLLLLMLIYSKSVLTLYSFELWMLAI